MNYYPKSAKPIETHTHRHDKKDDHINKTEEVEKLNSAQVDVKAGKKSKNVMKPEN